MDKNKVTILWSGGWDGTFRFLQLMQYDIEIQPVYVIDPDRVSTQYELAAIDKIITESKKRFRATVLDVQFYEKEWIFENCKNEEISRAFRYLQKTYEIGKQYEWFALLSNKLGLKMECAVVKQYKESVEKAINKEGSFVPIEHDFLPNRYCVQTKKKTSAVNTVFGNLIFPVFYLTKKDEERIAKKNGWIDIMELSWFCHTPINGKPCGICGPCDDVVVAGMKWRLPKEARRRHHFVLIYYWKRKLKEKITDMRKTM